ncbi:Bug family tripartite tricarboxylate transporter substrate binding protein [Pseudomonas chlororaphis]|uniref:Bug family tripartite tricarboxylate transporter substrate binding protein n=1 Tax=Pseudomonas chlororaphis TaxID=587753 RepID=UPI000F57CF6C|nr:tripartite tricarboxylate transporter substrate-binding protein [Pseudomonas chlororaphis]AZE04389.1 Tricarboxylate transport protein TctC [Pseudomonas chlororaphis subsp. aureofaciens]AZE16595.1 Tricarboxylate transport protein TctC [Pseudomonas chlororaphis subsp. aureofaciens]MBP5065409.1 tripartite tricarboxylate transporter substrate binding protein [Pseudomonas chlororaphis]QTT93944.1 tripartite tricarboxylate transporter substrate binding protein [Pseudomonas chlororaphis]
MFTALRRFSRGMAIAASLATLILATPAFALDTVKFMAPGSVGGGYDQTARVLGKALLEAGTAKSVTFENKGGAGGTLGLAQFANSTKGDPNALLVVGAIMVTAVEQNKPQISLKDVTPIARLFTEYNVLAVREESPYKTLEELLKDFKANPASIKWGGGSKGSIDHIGIAELASKMEVPVNQVNYVAYAGGGEVVAATLGGHITVITGGYAELAKYVQSKQFRLLAIGAPERVPGIDAPTLKEKGYDVIIGNWRGVYGAANLTAEQRKQVTDAVLAATNSKVWQDNVKANAWSPSILTGDEFGKFVDEEHQRLRAMLVKVGLL